MGIMICLDPGHGGSDQGYVGYTLPEKNICLDLAHRVEKKLRLYDGIEVALTRTLDVDVTVKERIEKANHKQADLFISLHAQSLDGDHVNGFTSYVSVFSDNRVRRWQCWVHNRIVQFLRKYGICDLGKKNDTETGNGLLKELRQTKMPAITLASPFITYPRDKGLWSDINFRDQYAECISEGIVNIFYSR